MYAQPSALLRPFSPAAASVMTLNHIVASVEVILMSAHSPTSSATAGQRCMSSSPPRWLSERWRSSRSERKAGRIRWLAQERDRAIVAGLRQSLGQSPEVP
jgi:hypothetical protein